MDKEILDLSVSDIIQFFIQCLDNGYYVDTIVECSYIAEYKRENSFPHGIFIYGYDLQNQIFHFADFINGRYSYSTATFFEIREAYRHHKTENFWINGTKLIKHKSDGYYDFDLITVRELLTDYLTGRDTSWRYSMDQNNYFLVFGLDEVYNRLKDDLEAFITNDTGKYIDIRGFHVQYDHKKAMSIIIHYLENNDYLDKNNNYLSRYRIIEQKALVIRNYFLKLSMIGNKNNLKLKIMSLIDSLMKEERELLMRMNSELYKLPFTITIK